MITPPNKVKIEMSSTFKCEFGGAIGGELLGDLVGFDVRPSQLEHSLPPGRHVVFLVAQSAGATQHCQPLAHVLAPSVQVCQLPTVPPLQLEHSLPPGRHVVFPVAQSAGATQHCQPLAHVLAPLVQVSQLAIVSPPTLGIQRICPICKLIHLEFMVGLADMMSDPVRLYISPIKLQLSPLTTVYSCAHDPALPEPSFPFGRHVVFKVAQSSGATQHCQLSAHVLLAVQLCQLPIVPPELGMQRICPTRKLVQLELTVGLADMIADPVTPSSDPIELQVSPLTTAYFCVHDPSGIQRICPPCILVHQELTVGLADMMSVPVTPNLPPIPSQVSPLVTVYFCMHDLSGIQRI